jgi:hypothetical protein
LLVMDTLKDLPGVPGLFVAGVFSAALRWTLILYVGFGAHSGNYEVSSLLDCNSV